MIQSARHDGLVVLDDDDRLTAGDEPVEDGVCGRSAAQATACPSSWPSSSCLHLLAGAGFAVSVGVAWLDLTSFEQYD
jgi:hypothetical protein